MRAQQGGLGVVATDRNVVWTCSIDGTAMDRCRSDGAVSAAEHTNRHGVLEEWRIEISKDMGARGHGKHKAYSEDEEAVHKRDA